MKKQQKGFKISKKILIPIFIFLLLISIVLASTWITETQSDFDEGIYDLIYYNDTINAVILNHTDGIYNTSGNYTSKVFNANSTVTWNNISWTEGVPYQQELPNNKIVEAILGGANMTENMLLMHLNNDSDYGENDTIAFDFSYTNNNGTWQGSAKAEADGKFGKAGNFSGNDGDYLNVLDNDSLDITQTLTVESWVYFNEIVSGDSIIYKNQAYRLTLRPSNTVRCSVYRATFRDIDSSAEVITTGKWHHIVCTIDLTANPEEAYIYVDGVEVVQADPAGSGDIGTSAADLHIGCNHNGANCLNGSLDEVAVYNRTLSAAEILNHYKRGALRLNLTVRSCDDSACSGESWTDVNDTSPQDLSVANNTYFQYKFEFETDNESYTPELYNITIDYLDISAPTITFVTPSDYNKSASQDWYYVNITLDEAGTSANLEDNKTGSFVNYSMSQGTTNTEWHINQTLTGLTDGNITWRIYANDTTENTASTGDSWIALEIIPPVPPTPETIGGGGGGGGRTATITESVEIRILPPIRTEVTGGGIPAEIITETAEEIITSPEEILIEEETPAISALIVASNVLRTTILSAILIIGLFLSIYYVLIYKKFNL